jgi:hypothetical protein
LARAQRAAAAAQAQCANCADQDRLSQQHIDAALAPMHAAADAVAFGRAARGGKRRAVAAAAAAAAGSGGAAAALSADSGRVLLRAVPQQSGYWRARREGRSAQYVAARFNASVKEAAMVDPAAPEVEEPYAKPQKQKAPLTAFWKRFESFGYGHAPAWDCSDRLSAGAAKRQSSNWKKAGLWS